MKFTSEDLMKAMGLSVGDRIKIKYITVDDREIDELYEIKQYADRFCLENDNYLENIEYLVNTDYEILPKHKRVGDLKCDDFECDNCPLKYLCCLKDWGFKTTNNLFHILNVFDCADTGIHDLLKARLDKEVNE